MSSFENAEFLVEKGLEGLEFLSRRRLGFAIVRCVHQMIQNVLSTCLAASLGQIKVDN